MAATMVMMLFLGVASAAYQGGGDQTYHTEDEHLSHGGPGGNGTMSADPTAIIVLMALFCAVVVTLAAWRVYSNDGKPEEKPEEKAQPELEMTVGADLEEGVERKESKGSQISTAASDVPLVV